MLKYYEVQGLEGFESLYCREVDLIPLISTVLSENLLTPICTDIALYEIVISTLKEAPNALLDIATPTHGNFTGVRIPALVALLESLVYVDANCLMRDVLNLCENVIVLEFDKADN